MKLQHAQNARNSHWFHKAIKADCYCILVRLIADDFQGLKLKTFFPAPCGLLTDIWKRGRPSQLAFAILAEWRAISTFCESENFQFITISGVSLNL